MWPSQKTRTLFNINFRSYQGDIIIISARLWNFKDGWVLKSKFLAKNQHTGRKKFKRYKLMNVSRSKIGHYFSNKVIQAREKN
jgi:hypothetical protein